jgi:outer membrane protein assembly factor BamB
MITYGINANQERRLALRAKTLLCGFCGMILAGGVLAPAPASIARGADAGDWPRWRGPLGDGISHDPIADKWPEDGPKKLWEQPAGLGYSSPVAQGGKVYLFASGADGQETLSSFDAQTGKPLWSQGYPMHDHIDYPGARATPFIDGDFIYTYGAGGDLAGWALADGKPVWRLNVVKETGAKLLGDNQVWAEASSPLVAGELVYVQGGKEGPVAVAVNKATGKIAWQSEAKGLAGYAACVLGEVAEGGSQLFVFGGDALYGMEPASGKTLWSLPWKTQYNINAATPLFDGAHLFVTSDYNHGCMMVEVGKAGARKLWDNKSVQSRFQAPVLDGKFLYSNSDDKRGTLKCLSWPDGKLAWDVKEPDLKLGFGGSILRDDDKLIALSQDGVLSLLKATPEAYEKLSQFKLFTPKGENSASTPDIWSSPILYHGKLYAKGEDTLVCLDLGK